MTKARKQHKNTAQYTWAHVAFRAVDGGLNLINNNRIYPLFGVLALCIAALIVWKLPASTLGTILTTLVNEFIVNKGGLIAMIIISNMAWLYMFNRMRRLYSDEIKRLSEIRSDLMHNNTTHKIEKHRSTNDECKETHIFPISLKKDQ